MAYGTINADVIGTSVAGSNIGAGNASAMKNRLINGAMVIDQRNAGASVTLSGGTYTMDRWKADTSQASKFTVQQNAGSVTPPAGFNNYLGVTSTSAYSVLTSDYFSITQSIEGYNVADLDWGTVNAKTVTLSFWVRSSLTGTFSGSLINADNTRSYPFSYSISSANTWEQKSITIIGDTTGTWLKNNSYGIKVWFSLGTGATYKGTAGSWLPSLYLGAIGETSVVGTSGATFYITGVQLEVGSSATGFEYRQYGQELALCQRYCFNVAQDTSVLSMYNGLSRGSGTYFYSIPTPVAMRTTPSFAVSNSGTVRITYNGTEANSSANSSTVGGSAMTINFGTSIANRNLILVSYETVSGVSSAAGRADLGLTFNYGTFIFSAEL